jgi:hypothetical protein
MHHAPSQSAQNARTCVRSADSTEHANAPVRQVHVWLPAQTLDESRPKRRASANRSLASRVAKLWISVGERGDQR